MLRVKGAQQFLIRGRKGPFIRDTVRGAIRIGPWTTFSGTPGHKSIIAHMYYFVLLRTARCGWRSASAAGGTPCQVSRHPPGPCVPNTRGRRGDLGPMPRTPIKSKYRSNRGPPAVRGARRESTCAQFLIDSPRDKGRIRGDRDTPRDARAPGAGHARPTPAHRSRRHRAAPARAQRTPRRPLCAALDAYSDREPRNHQGGTPPGPACAPPVRAPPACDESLAAPTWGTAVRRLHLRGMQGRMRSAGHVEASGQHAAPLLVRWVREGHAAMNTASTTHPCGCLRPAGAVPVSA